MTTLSSTLDELVALARHFRSMSEPEYVRARLPTLRALSELLYYHTMPPDPVNFDRPLVEHIHCSFLDCAITSATPDACILNFARGAEAPLWLCRAHWPPLEQSLPPPGYQPSVGELAALETERKAVLAKLNPHERHLINSRVVDMGKPAHD